MKKKLLIGLGAVLGTALVAVLLVWAATFVDDTADEFNAGTYNETQWDGTNNWVELTATGQTNGSGDYTSSVKDAGGHSSWDNIAWTPERPIGKELPDGAASETAYTSGNANMTGNVLLMHMNEASGTIVDSSGEGNNGTYNGALYSQAGKLNTAIGFDGSNDVIVGPSSHDITGDNSQNVTQSLWFRTTSATYMYTSSLKRQSAAAGYSTLFSLFVGRGGAGNVGLLTYNAAGSHTYLDYGSGYNDGQWHHLVGVVDGGQRIIYLDGVNVVSDNAGMYNVTNNTAEFTVGGFAPSYASLYFNGSIDEVAVYNRSLAPTEVADLYKRGALRLKYQARSCDDDACSGESFIGPDGTITDYYEWGTTNSTSTPSFNLTNVSDNQYFQYKAYFETDDSSYTPELKSVTADYTVLNEPPDTPTNSLPANGATNQSLTPSLTSSAFSDPDAGDTHQASQWQITTTSGDYSSPVYDSGTDVSNLTLITIPASTLSSGTTYYWHVRYQDDNSNWSSYSTETSFTTSYSPSTPTNSSPSNGALNQKITPTLSASAFSDSDAGATHTASQWLIRDLSDASYSSPVYDSGTDTNNLTSISIPSGNLSKNTTYFWKVRYQDEIGVWSSYSSETAFSTGVVPITVIAVGATEYTAGETARLSVQVTDADGSAVNDATVAINIYSPSGILLIDGMSTSMDYLADSNGLYYYNYTIPATIGVYTYDVTATYSSQTGYSAHTFHVAQFAADITAILEDTGTTLPAQITAVQTDVTAILEDTETTLPAQISGVEGKIDTIQAGVTSIKTAVGADEATTLYSKVTDIETYAKRLQAEILNRETSVKSGSTIKIRYRSVSGLTLADRPGIDMFDPDGDQVLTGEKKMDEISGSGGVYAYSIFLDPNWTPATGEFTVVCQDTTTGQLDSLILTVLTTDLADIRSGITDLETHLTTVEGKIDTIDGNIDSLMTTCDAVKAETDKITSDVLANIATVDGKVVTVDTVVDAIKLKTDDIDWTNVTDIKTETDKITSGVLADLGLVKGYTVNLGADIATVDGKVVAVDTVVDAIKVKTDTIVWGNITEVKAKTDTILWTDVTDISIESDKIAAIKVTVDDTNTKIGDVNLDTAAVIEKWGSVDGDTLAAYVDDLESKLGAPTDASTADSVFGDIKILQEKWGDYAASDIYDITAGTTVVPSTVSNEVLVAATDAYNQMEALRAEVRALGKTAPAYETLLNLQASLNRVNAALEKLETASTHPLYAQVLELANQLKATGIVKGEKVMSLYEVSAKQAEDVEYLKKKLEKLKAVAELSKEIVAEKKKERKKTIIKTNW